MKRGIPLLLALLAALVVAGLAGADPPQLTEQRASSGFYPCPEQTDFNRAPLLTECPAPNRLRTVVATCDPAGVSSLSLTRTGTAYGAPPLFNGTYTETINWTIGPQTGPVQPAFQPFAGSGVRAESMGFPTGELLSLDATFTIVTGTTVITGTKSLVANDGNYGVCREFTDEVTGNPVFGAAPLTGYFYILTAGVLAYDATIDGPGDPTIESGLAESYVMNSFATCCSSASPNSATGHLGVGFGTTHPAAGSSGNAPTSEGGNVEVEPLPGVDLTFESVDVGGITTAVLTTDVPELPAGFQVGDPPAYYEIATTASFTGLITVCLPYGSLPEGTTPKILHYEGGSWEDVTTSVSGPPDQIVCGVVDSLSPFAVVGSDAAVYDVAGPFRPVAPTPAVNTVKAGQAVPIKFSLGGDYGLSVIEAGFPTSSGGPCVGGPTDTTATTANGPGLSYDGLKDVYTYHWKTSKAWKGHCRTLTVRFDDGQELVAEFKFK